MNLWIKLKMLDNRNFVVGWKFSILLRWMIRSLYSRERPGGQWIYDSFISPVLYLPLPILEGLGPLIRPLTDCHRPQ